ncbi:hypothetical protein ACTQ54_12155 [Fundicoccus sp. Sow4_H7]|uniref:hypothetical protein n=1 Tax=Fundicoccus sp. Sow4_H7 TaxID=3438784 RepID=UPI003F8FE116
MKKMMKRMVASFTAVSLLIAQAPVAIMAQTESEEDASTETVIEEAASEETDEASVELTEETTEEAEATEEANAHPFDDLIANGNLMDNILADIYEDFKTIMEQVQIHDVGLWTGEGTTIDEAEGLLDREFIRETVVEGEEYVSYRYYNEGMEGDDAGLIAEIMLYFIEGNLVYVGVIPISHTVEPYQVLPESEIENMYDSGSTLEEFIALDPLVSSFAQSYYNGKPVYIITTASGETMDEIQAEIFIFSDETFEMSYYLPYLEAIEFLNQTMLEVAFQHFYSQGLVFGQEAEESTEEAATEETVEEEATDSE